jgi:hypothetical protein
MVNLVLKSARFSSYVGSGELSADELLEAYSAFLDSSPTPLTLVNLAAASLERIDAKDIEALAERMMDTGKGRWQGKAAIVCKRSRGFSLAYLLVTLLDLMGHPAHLAVFSGPNAARRWLRGQTGQPH